MRSHKPLVLIVEDNPEDFEAVRRAFAHLGGAPRMARCETGDEALDYLHGRGLFASGTQPRPGLVLLDLNLPGTDGRAVLDEIKHTKAFCDIPVVVLTTSSDPRDIAACYQAGANSYIEKPTTAEALRQVLARLQEDLVRDRAAPDERVVMATATRRVLIVDDSEIDREVCCRYLSADACCAREAAGYLRSRVEQPAPVVAPVDRPRSR